MINFSSLSTEWNGNPPPVMAIAQPWPGAPYLPLTGGGTAHMSPDRYEAELKSNFEAQEGSHYQVHVWETDPSNVANQYVLKGWHRFDSADPYQAVFVLYYDAVSRRETIEEHMPELLEEYLSAQPQEALLVTL